MREQADIVVIGAGPAGIAAAVRAAESGARVLLVDEGVRTGGQIWRHGPHAALPRRARVWQDRLARSGARILNATTVLDAERLHGAWQITAEREHGAVWIRARAIIIATGARELFLPFPGWTLPGVVGVGGAQALLKNGLEVSGRRVVIAGSGPLLFPVAASFASAGARVATVAEQAPGAAVRRFATGLWRTPARVFDAARYRISFMRTPYRTGTWVTHARGDGRVAEVVVTDGGRERTIPCDLLCVGYGLVPSTELARVAGCAVTNGAVTVDQEQRTSAENVFCAGEPCGIAGMDAALVQGEIAGLVAAGRANDARALFAERDAHAAFAARLQQAFALRPELRTLSRPDTIVCRCEDASFGQLQACAGIREAKLYTRAGMGPCQGRVCGAAAEFLFGWERDTVRPPVAAARVGTLAGTP